MEKIKTGNKHPNQIFWDLWNENKTEIPQEKKICNGSQMRYLITMLDKETLDKPKYAKIYQAVYFGHIKTSSYGKPLYFHLATDEEIAEAMKFEFKAYGLDENATFGDLIKRIHSDPNVEDIEDIEDDELEDPKTQPECSCGTDEE